MFSLSVEHSCLQHFSLTGYFLGYSHIMTNLSNKKVNNNLSDVTGFDLFMNNIQPSLDSLV